MRIKKIICILFLTMGFFPTYGYCDMGDEGGNGIDQDSSYPSYQSDYNYGASPQSYDSYTLSSNDDYDAYSYEEVHPRKKNKVHRSAYASRLPALISSPGEKVIIVDPREHVWGAYSAKGVLLRAGLATAGGKWCADIGRSCRTKTGSFRISSLGSSDCVSTKYPIEEGGGAPMPYCMYFNGGQGIHGSNHVAEANISHGCVRVSVNDAEWIRFNFANVGTKVIVKSY